LNNRIKKR